MTTVTRMGELWDALTPNQRRLMVLDHDIAELEWLVQMNPTMVPLLESYRQKRAEFEHERLHLNAAIQACERKLRH